MSKYEKGKTYKLTFANLKGGVAKTTSTAALSYILGQKGFKVLAVDTDSQCNLTSLFGQEPENIDLTINEVILGEKNINECIIRDVEENVDLLPSSIYLSVLETKIVTAFHREHLLENVISQLETHYDFIIFDTPPALNIMTSNVYMCCDSVVVPCEADVLSLKAIDSLNECLSIIKQIHPIEILGILMTRVERLRGDKAIMEYSVKLAEILNTKVYNTYIRAQKNVKESRIVSTNVVKYSSENRRKDREDAGMDYEKFAEEFLNDLGVEVNE